jgi:hypothetical protein
MVSDTGFRLGTSLAFLLIEPGPTAARDLDNGVTTARISRERGAFFIFIAFES